MPLHPALFDNLQPPIWAVFFVCSHFLRPRLALLLTNCHPHQYVL